MWPFRPKPLLEPEMSDWMFDQAAWLLSAHSHRAAFAAAQLLPLSEKAFPSQGARGHALAECMLSHVLRYAGAEKLRVRLVPTNDSERYRQDGPGPSVQPRMTAAGTYRSGGFAAEISYDESLLKIPADLIAVLAHEVAHAVLDFGAGRAPPGDEEFEEMRTDFTAVFLGFGFYLAQYRADTRVMSAETAHEWKGLFMYYMNLREISFATALFCAARGIEKSPVLRRAPGAAVPHLKRAFADIAREDSRVAALRALAKDAAGAGPGLRLVPGGRN